MKGTKKGIVLALFLVGFASLAFAEPSYLIYPNAPAVFRYDSDRYVLLAQGDPKFDPSYAIANQMLWDVVEERVPVEIYRAPLITSFERSPSGLNEFVVVGNDFEVVVDGFGPTPRTIGGLCIRFWPEPNQTFVQLSVDGHPTAGLTHGLSALEVSTATGSGYYADTSRFMLSWVGASHLRVIAFSDKNADRAFEGTPRFSIVARDETVPVAPTTWGQIKSMYSR